MTTRYDRNRLVGNMRAGLEWLQKSINTCMPGSVVAFDAASARASVQPAIRMRLRSGDEAELPVVADVPVVYPSGGGYALTFPLAAGDPVLLLFSQRGLTAWKETLEVASPDAGVFHALNDAIAIPGFASAASADALEITTPQGGAIRINGVALEDFIRSVVAQP